MMPADAYPGGCMHLVKDRIRFLGLPQGYRYNE